MENSSSASLTCSGIDRVPDLNFAHQKFLLSLAEYRYDDQLKAALIETMRSKDMSPMYEKICKEYGWSYDVDLLNTMVNNNKNTIINLNDKIEAAKSLSCISDVRDAYFEKALYFATIGDKDNAVDTLELALANTVAIGYKMDNVLTRIRIGIFFHDYNLVKSSLEKADDLAAMGVDYDKRNRLKIYRGIYALMVRDFSLASCMFITVIDTFSCNELLDYSSFIRYTVFAALYALPRTELKEKIITNGGVLQTLTQDPEVKKFLLSLYNCEYGNFFISLARIETIFRENYILNPHYRFYVQEMRIKAYLQFLTSYKSLTFNFMAEQFRVTPEFIETELVRFISGGRISAKIDKIKNCIVLSRDGTERRSEMFSNVIRQGDVLLNRVQYLRRALDSSI